MKIIYCGYDFFSSCLQHLLDAGHEILKVYSFPCTEALDSNTYIRAICQQHHLAFTEQRIDKQSILDLQDQGGEVLITAGYPYKIPQLEDTTVRGINIHPMLLPNGKGGWPLPWIILKDLPEAGITLHKLSQQWDSGDTLLQDRFTVQHNENLESLSAKAQMKAKQLMHVCFQDFDRFWDQAKPQTGAGSYWPYPTQQDRSIDWHSGIVRIDRTCRAFGKAGCFAAFDNQIWLVSDLNAWPEQHQYPPGVVVHKTNTEMIVAASDGLCSMRYFEAAPNIKL